jgi:streptogramin lyase
MTVIRHSPSSLRNLPPTMVAERAVACKLRFVAALAGIILTAMTAGCTASQTSARPQSQPAPLVFIGSWGVKGSDPGQLDKPYSIATDGVGNVFIADAGNLYIGKFDPEGTPLLSFQELGLHHPQWVTVDSGGAIYVSDPVRSVIFVFLPDGDRYRELRARAKTNAENFLSVAVDDDGTVYALDGATGNVTQFNSRLRFTRYWPVPGIPKGTGIPAGPIEVGKDGSLYVADSSTGLIRHISHDGQVLDEIGPPPTGGKLSARFALSSNDVFAMDANGRTVHIFGIDGAYKLSVDLAPQFGQAGRNPPALATSPRRELLVLDDSAARVLRYRIQL